MRGQSEADLKTFRGWILRVQVNKSASARLLLLLHGWTGDENSMWVFARGLGSRYWIMAPRAPHPTRPGGYSWRIPPPEMSEGPGLDDLRGAAFAVTKLVDEYSAEQRLESPSFDVVGFSQGAALAGALAVLFPKRVEKVALLSGFLPNGAEALLSAGLLQGVEFFVAHGTMDDMVSIGHARESARLLKEAGASVTVCEDDVGHKVSAACLRGLQAFFT